MFITAALFAAALSSAVSPKAAPAELAPALSATAVLLDCQVTGAGLRDCRVPDEDPANDAQRAEALRLAAQIEVPEDLALANPGRIRIKLNVNP